jgi:hypothetical protein
MENLFERRARTSTLVRCELTLLYEPRPGEKQRKSTGVFMSDLPEFMIVVQSPSRLPSMPPTAATPATLPRVPPLSEPTPGR